MQWLENGARERERERQISVVIIFLSRFLSFRLTLPLNWFFVFINLLVFLLLSPLCFLLFYFFSFFCYSLLLSISFRFVSFCLFVRDVKTNLMLQYPLRIYLLYIYVTVFLCCIAKIKFFFSLFFYFLLYLFRCSCTLFRLFVVVFFNLNFLFPLFFQVSSCSFCSINLFSFFTAADESVDTVLNTFHCCF